MRRWRIGLVALAAAAAGLAATRPPHTEPAFSTAPKESTWLLGIVGQWGRDARLVRVDERSLRPLGRQKLEIFGSAGAWAFSPDRSRLALVTGCQAGVSLGTLELVDAQALRSVGCLAVGNVGAVAWPAPNRLLAMANSEVLLIDPIAQRVIQRTPAESSSVPAASARVHDRLVGLYGLVRPRSRQFVPQRLIVADSRGSVRSVRLEGLRPSGLVVDSAGRYAYLVSVATVVRVDLGTLAVDSVLRGSANGNRQVSHETRGALWLGEGLIASFGRDQTRRGRWGVDMPVGLRLIDLRRRTVRVLEERANSASLAGDVILATGSKIGLVAFDRHGRRRFQLFRGRRVVVLETFRGKAYVEMAVTSPLRVVDVRSGRVLGTRTAPLPTLLVER